MQATPVATNAIIKKIREQREQALDNAAILEGRIAELVASLTLANEKIDQLEDRLGISKQPDQPAEGALPAAA